MREELREALADYAHEAWSGWMEYLFSKSTPNPGGTWTMPAWAANRWLRQMETPYAELPEGEKESDRAEADKMLALMRDHVLRAMADVLRGLEEASCDCEEGCADCAASQEPPDVAEPWIAGLPKLGRDPD